MRQCGRGAGQRVEREGSFLGSCRPASSPDLVLGAGGGNWGEQKRLSRGVLFVFCILRGNSFQS